MDIAHSVRDAEPIEPSSSVREHDSAASAAAVWARLYHFLELGLAHPAEEGFAYFRGPNAEAEFQSAIRQLPNRDELINQAVFAGRAFFDALRARSFEELEADHIGLFSANFPAVPCPPYGSLFTAPESKRLEEMLAIKGFYHRSGVDISGSFDDLPDHICVELEFLQLICFRLEDAIARGDLALVERLRRTLIEFFDRFFLPFVQRLAPLAIRMTPENPYAHLLHAAQALAEHSRGQIERDLGLSAALLMRESEP